MKTQAEFNDKLKKHMRRARKGLWLVKIAKNMHMTPAIYSAYEQSKINLTIYQLYEFMHATGKDAEFIKQLFDDDYEWRPTPRTTNDE